MTDKDMAPCSVSEHRQRDEWLTVAVIGDSDLRKCPKCWRWVHKSTGLLEDFTMQDWLQQAELDTWFGGPLDMVGS